MLTEAWFSSHDGICLKGYNAAFLNRTMRRGGGVCMLIKQRINYELLDDLSLCSLHIEVIYLKHGTYFFAVYPVYLLGM